MSNPINGYALQKGNSVCPATEQDLKDFLRLDDSQCGNLTIYLESAKDAVIAYLGTALLEQEFTVVFDGYPFKGTQTYGLSQDAVIPKDWISLPYGKDAVIDSVKIITDTDEQTITSENYVIDNYSIPSRIKFITSFPYGCDTGRLAITYTSGFGTDTEDVPLAIRLGLLQVAGYLYEHRGECSPASLIADAGASIALNPYRIIGKL